MDLQAAPPDRAHKSDRLEREGVDLSLESVVEILRIGPNVIEAGERCAEALTGHHPLQAGVDLSFESVLRHECVARAGGT